MKPSSEDVPVARGACKASRRFLRTFIWSVAVVACVVASINLFAFRYMLLAENQTLVQLLAGWGRMYKPILYDEFKPSVAVFGGSHARDAFEPMESSQLLGKQVFNHGLSGATAYETRRFVQSALLNPNLEDAVINLDTIYRDRDMRTRFKFNEAVLNVDPDGKPNRWVRLQRSYLLALTGGATAYNYTLLMAIRARKRGAELATYLPPYEQADLTRLKPQLEELKQQIFPENRSERSAPSESLSTFQAVGAMELELIIDGLCQRSVNIYAYFTPRPIWWTCEADVGRELESLRILRRKQASCPAKISYFDFNYPNAITLEGILSDAAVSDYYRPDAHPRPTVGRLMIAQMFGLELPDSAPHGLADDFGVELLTHPDAEEWLRRRALRCAGYWGEDTDLVDQLLSAAR